MIPDCEKCPYKKMCHKGFVIDCETGEILDPPGEDIGSATYRAVQEQNDSYFITVFKKIGEKQDKLTNESDELLEEEDDYVQHNFYGY